MKIITLLALALATLTLSACGNTFKGAGRDIERAGQAIQDTF